MSDPVYKPMRGWGTGAGDGPPILAPNGTDPVCMLSPCPYAQWQPFVWIAGSKVDVSLPYTPSGGNATVSGGAGAYTITGIADGFDNGADLGLKMIYEGHANIKLDYSSAGDTYDQNEIQGNLYPGAIYFALDSSHPTVTLPVRYYRWWINFSGFVWFYSSVTLSASLV